ncbi:YciI family protein [Shinella sp.]|uniref:YciI family protein n=1 Tax=Shinella sp. TaxID=1870904 RepID=UPI003F72FCAF
MQFLIVARDHPGAGPKMKRANARGEHMRLLHQLKAEGKIHDAGAILSEEGEMVGSMIIADFPDRASLDAYLRLEPFRRDGIWGDVEIVPFRTVNWALQPPKDDQG